MMWTVSRRKLLIVDDQLVFRAQFRRALTETGLEQTFEFAEASNGHEGLDVLLNDDTVEYVVVDVHMPELDGPSMLRALEAEKPGRIRELKVFMITTSADRSLMKEFEQLGIEAWLVKPLDPTQFVSWLGNTLAQQDTADGLSVAR